MTARRSATWKPRGTRNIGFTRHRLLEEICMKSRTRKVASVAFTGVAATGMIGFAAGPAFASGGKWVLNPGSGTYSGQGTNTKLGVSTPIGVVSLTCPTASASGHLSNNVPVGNPWAKIGTVSHATFGSANNQCALGTIKFTATLNKPVNLSLSGSHTSKGRIHGSISATLTGSHSCHALITGSTVPGSWNNSTHTLNINKAHSKTLTVKSAHNCTGIASGEKAFFSAPYKLLGTRATQTITDP
jgi:hypothetical protein